MKNIVNAIPAVWVNYCKSDCAKRKLMGYSFASSTECPKWIEEHAQHDGKYIAESDVKKVVAICKSKMRHLEKKIDERCQENSRARRFSDDVVGALYDALSLVQFDVEELFENSWRNVGLKVKR